MLFEIWNLPYIHICVIKINLIFFPMGFTEYILAAIVAAFAGAVNAIAGGGTLISFPVLTALGVPAVAANITNTVALSPGYLGATYAQLKDLKSQRSRLLWFIPAAVIGGIAGGLLLLLTGEKAFRELVPYLILLASFLLAVQDPLRKWLISKSNSEHGISETAGVVPVLFAAVYGGYFGAGLSVIVLAVLGLTLSDNLTRLNALKQFIAFCVNISAAIFFVFSGYVLWYTALVMALGALVGGIIGGRFAGSISPSVLRIVVVTIGIVVSIIYFVS